MRRRVIGVAFAGASALAARALAPRLHARLMAGCERMFEQMPDDFPPKRMMRGIEETRANSARTLALLEAREQAREAETLAAASPRTDGAARLGRNEERELAKAGASVPEHDRTPDA
jgi:hypothetical protein